MSEATLQSNRRDFSRLQQWRENILQSLFYTLLVIGLVMLITNIRSFIASDQWIMVGVVSIIYLTVLSITFLRRLPFGLRAGVVVGAFYILWPINFSLYGLTGDGRLWFLLAIMIGSILFGLRSGLILLALVTVTYAAMGVAELGGFVTGTLGWTPGNWISAGATLIFMGAISALSIGYLLDSLGGSLENLEATIRSEQDLASNLDQERAALEKRTLDLERRLGQIRTAAEISRTFGTILDPEELMQRVANLILNRFDLYYVGIFLNDERNHYAELRAGTGEAGERMLAQNHRLTVGGSSMIGWATAHLRPRIALDAGQEAIRFRNPHLPLTRSELALPLAIANQSIGALSIQSTQPEAFDDDDITVLQGIADSLAIALENARLFQQIDESLHEIQALNQAYVSESWRDILRSDEDLTFTVENPSLPGQASSEVRIPMTLRDEQVIGNITLQGSNESWGDDDMEFIEAVSTQAALALESARLLEESQRRVQREQALNTLTANFSRTLDFDSLMQSVVRELAQLPNIQDASVFFAAPEGAQPEPATNGSEPEEPADQEGLND